MVSPVLGVKDPCDATSAEVFPLICPHCGAAKRLIAFISFSSDIHKILGHIGADPEAPRITPARGPPP
ncbi:hypothetical protein [Rhodoferax sp.]|uniref:hypothetical protein n=1 Tax=Rhodoferax sp. TaxID=50421 RepID=UPI0025D2C4F2|nr:hypothetical protein [Rhodoferax sp.]MBU3997756.1 hypothetical protein [Gammaproteobacteria bacterium]MBU4079076.1 hypothetical protein [Gammaproteobacteria bacterium]MBU4114983.1 hypothetical protein [Gammaproteobacteria bacterium]MBU4171926.1 hypothetical protein [Gammaproteobacteria bacterium]